MTISKRTAKAWGWLSREATRALDPNAAGQTRTTPARPGMRSVCGWQGEAHVVLIDESGVIRWNERAWGSLSEVARAITGTRWSGQAFFGLKKKVAA